MKFKKLSMVIFLFLTIFEIFSETDFLYQEKVQDESNIITEIVFNGLKRTKESYLLKKYQKYIGVSEAEIDKKVLETELQMEGLFDKIEIKFEEIEDEKNETIEENKKIIGTGKTRIVITVSEKITFIPLPFAMWSSSGFMAGITVMDTNAFGVKDSFMIGGFYSSDSVTGMAMFSKPAGDDFKPGYSAFVSIAKNRPEIKNQDNEFMLDYENFSAGGSFSISEKLDDKNSVRLSLGFNYLKADDEKKIAPSIDSAKIGKVGLGYSFKKNNWNGWFMMNSGVSVSANLSKYFGLEKDSELASFIQNYAVSATFQRQFFHERLKFASHCSADLLVAKEGKSPHISEFKGGSSAGVSIFSGNFKTDKIIGGSIGLEFAIKKSTFGLFSIYGDYDIAFADDFTSEPYSPSFSSMKFNNGFDLGLRLYLSKVAFPALAVGFSYNITTAYPQFSLSLGLSM